MPGFGSSPRYFRRCLFETPSPLPEGIDLSTKCILLTGSTSGIGYECAKQLIHMKAGRLILPVRTLEHGEKAKERLLSDTKMTGSVNIELYVCDQESNESVAAFVEKLKTELHQPLDVAILNAGVNKFHQARTAQGTDVDLQVNHLSTALLSALLVPLLRSGKRSEPGRMTIMSSETHWWTAFDQRKEENILDSIDKVSGKNYDPGEQYNATKLLPLLWARELAKRYPDIVINIANPGFVKTNLARDVPAAIRPIMNLMYLILGRTPEVGARCLTYAAVVADASTHGKFLSEYKEMDVAPWIPTSEGQKAQERVWVETVDRLKVVCPEVATILG